MFGRNKDHDARPVPSARAASKQPTGETTGSGRAPDARNKPQNAAGRLAYEARRAEKAGMGLEKWMAEKSRRVQEQRAAAERAQRKAAAPAAKPGLLRRLIDRAHKPL